MSGVDFLGNALTGSDSVTTVVQAPVLTLSMTATATAGEMIQYTIHYANTGSGAAAGVSIVDSIPAGVFYSTALDQGAGPRPTTVTLNADGTRTLVWTVGALAGHSGDQTLSFTARPTLLALGGAAFGATGMPYVLEQQLLATYFNLATRRLNAATRIQSKTDTRLGLSRPQRSTRSTAGSRSAESTGPVDSEVTRQTTFAGAGAGSGGGRGVSFRQTATSPGFCAPPCGIRPKTWSRERARSMHLTGGMNARIWQRLVLAGIAVTLAACSESKPAAPATPTADAEAALPPSELDTQLPPAIRETVLKPFTGDLDAMIGRRLVRMGVTFNRTFYFVDKGVQRGISYEYGQLVEERLNLHAKTGIDNKVYVVFVPLPRHLLLPALVQGRIDLVAAQITVSPDRQKVVDFTNPTRMNVSQVLVTNRETSPIDSVGTLSGREVFVRDTSNYRQSLLMLNDRLMAEGKPPVVIRTAPENLEDDDLLEMVNAGLIPAIIVDDYLANFWKKVFPNLQVHDRVAVRTGGTLAVAVRKNSPKLSAALNTFMGNYGLGTAFGNVVERKYLVNTTYAKSATATADRDRFLTLVRFFRKYSDQYNVDYLLMAAQGYQESGLDQNAKSGVGAIGVMQLMPATGREQNVGDIRKVEANIHAGVKYMHTTSDTFFKNEPMDNLNKALFTFASYNAGPGRIRQLRREAEQRGLDPNIWFGNVEVIAADRIGRETVTYVSNIYKYYVAYRLVVEDADRKAAAKATVTATDVK